VRTLTHGIGGCIPSPGQVICESAAHQRTCDTSNSIDAANDTHVRWPRLQRHSVCDDEHSSTEKTSSSNTRNGTTNDQSGGIRRDTADERSDFEDEESGKVDPFD
jgi:hypothetical protein